MARSRVELFEQIRKDRRAEGASIRELAEPLPRLSIGVTHLHRRNDTPRAAGASARRRGRGRLRRVLGEHRRDDSDGGYSCCGCRARAGQFSEWGTVFATRLVAAMVDRVTCNACIPETGTQSYQLATSKTTNGRGRAA